MEEEKLYWLGFSCLKGIGPKKFALLKNYFGTAKKAWLAKKGELLALGLGKKVVDELVKVRQDLNLTSYYLRLRENKIMPVFVEDKIYPSNLRSITNPPFILYTKGKIEAKDDISLAVVGSRLMTGYGEQVVGRLVHELVAAGLTIVSGLARGIDSAAHRTALNAGGRTIGVLGCGLDLCYPPENKQLIDKIVSGHGAVVSEYPLGMSAVPGNFPARNRIISGLSLGTLVIEGAKDSGSLITASLAAEQGREVFAVPGPITSRFSAGPAQLIKDGAKLVFDTNDILEELGIEERVMNQKAKQIIPETAEEGMLLSLITDEAKHLDQLARESGFDIASVTSIMTMLEIKGKVKDLGGMVYIVNS